MMPGRCCLTVQLSISSDPRRPTGPTFWLTTHVISGSEGWIAAQIEWPSGSARHNMSAEIDIKLLVGFRWIDAGSKLCYRSVRILSLLCALPFLLIFHKA